MFDPDPNDFRSVTLAVCMLHHEWRGLLTRYYPEGVDAMNPVYVRAQELAAKIREPVQLVFQSDSLGQVRQVYCPSGCGGFRGGGWTPAFSYDADDVPLESPGRLVAETELNFAMLFSGAPNREPVHILDTRLCVERADVERRLLELGRKTGTVVVHEFNETILHSSLLRRPPNTPLRPEDRQFFQEERLAKTLRTFGGGNPDMHLAL